MRTSMVCGIVMAGVVATGVSRGARVGAGADASVAAGYPIRPVAAAQVELTDAFWLPRLETNRRVSVPHIMRQNEATGRVANFAKAARRMTGAYQGRRFNDTDVYKAIEAASYSLRRHPDPALDRQLDELIALIAAAQEPDGYLFPARTIDPKNPAPGVGPERWVFENGSHELYNAGHLYEAAVAHAQATGKRTLLDVAIKNANLVASAFGPTRRKAAPGHQEIELALFRLAAFTGNKKYAELAHDFLEQRGRLHDTLPYPDGPFAMYNGREYKQDHVPVVDQARAVGHAVRATYMYAGMADVAGAFGEPRYKRALARLWQDVVSRRMYLTGGIGSIGGTEAFGDDYVLPSRTAYTETCAAIGHELWNHRMFLLEGDARYLDMQERILYNGYLSGVSLSGDRFFYQNPLESDGRRERSAYFEVACCPANVARLMEQVPGLVYAQRDADLYVGLFVASRARVTLAGREVRIAQQTRYPWDGAVRLQIEPVQPAEFALHLRIPGWARDEAVASDLYRFADVNADAGTRASTRPPTRPAAPTLAINGKDVPLTIDKGFVTLRRRWQAGDAIELRLPMPVRRVLAHEGIVENRGKAALQRGPLVYCLEGADHGGRVRDLVLPLDARLTDTFRADLLGGVVTLTGETRGQPIVAIPYFAWANRGRGEMAVWIRHTADAAAP